MGSDGLAEFLLARITEDEELAKDAAAYSDYQLRQFADGTGKWASGRGESRQPQIVAGPFYVYTSNFAKAKRLDQVASHIARHDPAHVLAECQAKRRLVTEVHFDRLAEFHADDDEHDDSWIPECHSCSCFSDCVVYLENCPTLQLLALPYADHQDYDPEWTVTPNSQGRFLTFLEGSGTPTTYR